jgi:hypothetical protein
MLSYKKRYLKSLLGNALSPLLKDLGLIAIFECLDDLLEVGFLLFCFGFECL